MALYQVRFVPLKTTLANLPPTLYSPLVAAQKRPQSLAVHVRTQDGREAYLGWSGLSSPRPPLQPPAASSSSSSSSPPARETLEVDPGVGASFGWADGQLVELAIVPSLPVAREVAVSPVSADDWEVIAAHAQWLEDNLLFSLRVAAVGQRVDVWVKGKTRVAMVVDRVEPKKPAVLLRSETEVHIKPLTRARPPAAATPAAAQAIQPVAGPSRSVSPAKTTSTGSGPKRRSSPDKKAKTLVATADVADGRVVDKVVGVGAAGQEAVEPYRGFRRGRELEAKLVAAAAAAGEEKGAEGAPASAPYLPGLEPVVQQALAFLVNAFVLQSGLFFPPTVSQSRTLLVTGAARSGKTTVVKEVAARLEQDTQTLTYTRYVDVSKLADERVPGLKEKLGELVRDVNANRPAVLVLDGLENLAGVDLPNTDSTRTTQVAELLVSLLQPDAGVFHSGTVVVCAARSAADVHPLLAQKHVFGSTVGLRGLTKDGRREVLDALVRAKIGSSAARLALDEDDPVNHLRVATETEGFLVSDVRDLVDRAVQQAAIRCSTTPGSTEINLAAADFTAALAGFVPFSLKDVKLQASSVKWSDIGGLQDVRRTLRETLEWPVKYAAIFKQSPLRLRSGLLLYGYPGCGKTLLASAVAKECGLNFISVKGPEILNKYIGASEKSVRDLFDRATAAKPCVLFFDEFDSIAPKRGHDSTGVTDRVVNQMLTQMDGAEGLDGVYVLAATSRPDLIDPALLRPGRLDKSLLCPMPSEQDRLEILESITRKLHLSPDVSLATLAAQTANYTGADLGGLVGTAHLAAVHASLESSAAALDGQADGTTAGRPALADGELLGEVVVIGRRRGKAAGKGTSRAEEGELRARVGKMVGVGRKDLGGSTAANGGGGATEAPITVIQPAQLATALASTRPSVPDHERARLGRIYGAFVDERSVDGLEGAEGGGTAVGSRSSLG